MHHALAVKQNTQPLSPARSMRSGRPMARNEESLAPKPGLPIFLQAKLAVGGPNDPYEQEADRVAESVMRMAEPASISTAPAAIRRKCALCEDETEDEEIQAKRTPTSNAAATVDTRAAVDAAKDGGEPLTDAARSYFEPRLGYDFSHVRVHADARAATAARAIQARAYTHGHDIVFGAGEYAPTQIEGQRLLAHELAHVVQQEGAAHAASGDESGSKQRENVVDGAAGATVPTLQRTTHSLAPIALTTSPPSLQRAVDPKFVIDDPYVGQTPGGAPLRIFFARNSTAIPASETSKINAFKSGPDRTAALTLIGLATEDELAANSTLSIDRASVVNKALAAPQPLPAPFNKAHAGRRIVRGGTLANTKDRPNVRFNRAVEVLRPGEVTMSPSTAIAAPTPCGAAIETAFQAAKVMAFQWIDLTRPQVQARPLSAMITAVLDLFFGSHADTIADRVDSNLGLIKSEIGSLAQAANHDCADPNLPGCVGAIAFNGGGTMTICSGYASRGAEDLARNLVHEAGHSTAGLSLTGRGTAPRTSDFAYRHERMIHLLGRVNTDQALSNSDSYSMFLMTLMAPLAITPDLLPVFDPAPSGFPSSGQATKTQRALALAEQWIRLAIVGLTDLHGLLRTIGTGKPVPADLSDPRRMDKILTEVVARFPPILSTANIRGDDLLMIAGVSDRCEEIKRLVKQPIAISRGVSTKLTATAPVAPAIKGSLSLSVDAVFLTANEQARARTIVDLLIELIPSARISVAMRPTYGAFIEFVRNMHQ